MEDIDFRTMAKGFLGKHTLDAGFGQFRDIWKYVCYECNYGIDYPVDRDVASAQEIGNRGRETHSRQGLCRMETVCQVEASGVMSLDNWRRGNLPLWAEISHRELGSPRHNL